MGSSMASRMVLRHVDARAIRALHRRNQPAALESGHGSARRPVTHHQRAPRLGQQRTAT